MLKMSYEFHGMMLKGLILKEMKIRKNNVDVAPTINSNFEDSNFS